MDTRGLDVRGYLNSRIMLLEKIQSSHRLEEISSDSLREVQECLRAGNYLQEADGILGALTKKAFKEFKEDCWLEHPDILGPSTAKKLLELKVRRQGTKEASQSPVLDLSVVGTFTGATMKLPDGKLVYENQLIIDGIPLTWGEATKGCTRVPCYNWEIANAIKLTKAFGEVRDKFGSPIVITSGYRPMEINRAVGGVSNSQHVPFKALDMIPANGAFPKLWQVLKASKFTGLGDGVSTGRGFYHADIRDGSRIIFGY